MQDIWQWDDITLQQMTYHVNSKDSANLTLLTNHRKYFIPLLPSWCKCKIWIRCWLLSLCYVMDSMIVWLVCCSLYSVLHKHKISFSDHHHQLIQNFVKPSTSSRWGELALISQFLTGQLISRIMSKIWKIL